MAKYPPSASLINSMAAQHFQWKLALAEWIDNSLDANAKGVHITFDGKNLNIKDDGNGCADVINMVQPGKHSRSSTTKLGRYGIGGKDAALWAGGTSSRVQIKSVHAGKRSEVSVHWAKYASTEGEIDDPVVVSAKPGEIGTDITVAPVIRRVPDGKEWEKLIDELGYLYTPAIKSGQQITVTRKVRSKLERRVLVRWHPPPLQEDRIKETIVVAGKPVHILCGLVCEGHENPRFGITYSYRFRVIKPASDAGCGAYKINRVCGIVHLGPEWELTKNKDDVLRDSEELYAAIEHTCRPILERADREGTILESDIFDKDLSRLINLAIAQQRRDENLNAKAKRSSPSGNAPVVPIESGRRHIRAARTQEGKSFPSGKPLGSVRVVHERLGEEKGLGEVKGPVIYLNLDHSAISHFHAEKNQACLLVLAMSILGVEHTFGGDTLQIPLIKGIRQGGTVQDFNSLMATILSRILPALSESAVSAA